MRPILPTVLFGFALSLSASSQTACSPGALPEAARTVASIRHGLHGVAVGELDPVVTPAVAAQLGHLKDALARAAAAAMACSAPAVTAETLDNTLAGALHANLSDAAETVLVTPSHKDLGAYGSDLQVQVLSLSPSPATFEIDFRYGVECGDDNLLLVYRLGSTPNTRWGEILRWDAPAYHTVGDAFGDFILLTPLTGLPDGPNWRAVVAHGHPGCSTTENRSRFDLDLLQPSTDPAHPDVVWHMDQPYTRGDSPRLATTEDSLTFELLPPEPEKPKFPTKTAQAASEIHAAGRASPRQIYRYRITADNRAQAMEAVPASQPNTIPPDVSKNSPR